MLKSLVLIVMSFSNVFKEAVLRDPMLCKELVKNEIKYVHYLVNEYKSNKYGESKLYPFVLKKLIERKKNFKLFLETNPSALEIDSRIKEDRKNEWNYLEYIAHESHFIRIIEKYIKNIQRAEKYIEDIQRLCDLFILDKNNIIEETIASWCKNLKERKPLLEEAEQFYKKLDKESIESREKKSEEEKNKLKEIEQKEREAWAEFMRKKKEVQLIEYRKIADDAFVIQRKNGEETTLEIFPDVLKLLNFEVV